MKGNHDILKLPDFREKIKFYGKFEPYYEFTNFYYAPITVDGKRWRTSEHYFQAQKFVGTPYLEKVRKAFSAREAFQLSRDPKVSRWCRTDWENVKEDVMRKALYCKFTQHPDLRRKLLETADKELIEHTSNDSYWGDGGDGSGLNRLGMLLMKVREELLLAASVKRQPLKRSNSLSRISPSIPSETGTSSYSPSSSYIYSHTYSSPKLSRSNSLSRLTSSTHRGATPSVHVPSRHCHVQVDSHTVTSKYSKHNNSSQVSECLKYHR